MSINVYENGQLKRIAGNAGTESGGAPVGTVIAFMGTSAPVNYITCDGQVYDINRYPLLAQHIYDQFGKYDYFDGDGVTTFAVPDLRGEFLRGTGKANRNTGSGSVVGVHQDPTELPHSLVGGTTFSHSKSDYVNPDTTIGNTTLGRLTNMSNTTSNYSVNFTTRPTNTSVLYCIKYQ